MHQRAAGELTQPRLSIRAASHRLSTNAHCAFTCFRIVACQPRSPECPPRRHFASGRPRAFRSTSASLARLLSAIGLVSLGACGPTSVFYGRDISTTLPPLKFTLTGQAGNTVTEEAVRGKVTLLYFGYTNSPDACPATLLKLALALEPLGDDAGSVRILFVSVDPQRDSPALLASYVDSYAPEVIGLTGSESELVTLTKRYRLEFRREAPDAMGAYAVHHSNDVLAFDRDGKARLLITPSETEEHVSEDLKTLIG